MGSITARNLGKAYKVYPSRFARLKEWLIPFSKPRHTLKWVLQDINFSVNPGEAIGIIGVNGAGKSTLLKMLTGTTIPTTGSVQTTGRVAALLELGIGFHPEFTGRQNAFMAGQLLGMSAEEIHQLMPQIEAFAEIGDYMDHPVRVYSSGMQMRLAFSVATARRPDILIIDEALSVGDAYFQHKSFERIRQFRRDGTTLLIVSHDKAAIQSICDRAILLNAGQLGMQGEPEAVMDYYNALLAERENQTVRQRTGEDGKVQTTSGTGEATVEDIALLDAKGEQAEVVDVGESVVLQIRVRIYAPIPLLVLGYLLKDRLGQAIYGTSTFQLGKAEQNLSAGDELLYQFSFDAALGEGTYSIATAITNSETHLSKNFEWRDGALFFQVINLTKPKFTGAIYLSTNQNVVRHRIENE
ncbi:ABC transporter ATP-binding protein [Polaromonas sp.]|uniref:ABC transporter ATP-binding protein n=1 Tax=Polaromonas sp. TaxID=1869339 RepID=UPI003265FCAD